MKKFIFSKVPCLQAYTLATLLTNELLQRYFQGFYLDFKNTVLSSPPPPSPPQFFLTAAQSLQKKISFLWKNKVTRPSYWYWLIKRLTRNGSCVCSHAESMPVILLVFCCTLYVHQPRLFIPGHWYFHFGLYDINDMDIIVKESFLSGILNAHSQTKEVFTTKLSRFSYLCYFFLVMMCLS